MLNEENYPMTYKEYEKRVVELLLEDCEGKALEILKAKVEDESQRSPILSICFMVRIDSLMTILKSLVKPARGLLRTVSYVRLLLQI